MRCPREQGVGLVPSSHRDRATWRELVALTRAGSVSVWGQEPGGSEGGGEVRLHRSCLQGDRQGSGEIGR